LSRSAGAIWAGFASILWIFGAALAGLGSAFAGGGTALAANVLERVHKATAVE